ncbi:hypothetical protein BC938DRAFT_483592 [Jimgerdemannia flammicorona]|nr:hypothetical protein BC938DRAFT_483592 [Jimgerdemannia flammicorona]
MNIFRAVKENNVAFIEALINSQNNPSSGSAPTKGGGQRSDGKGQKSAALNLNRWTLCGTTALHLAVTWDRREVVRALVECPQVNVNLVDRENRWTALHR